MKGYSMHEKHRANPKREREREREREKRHKREPSNILIKPNFYCFHIYCLAGSTALLLLLNYFDYNCNTTYIYIYIYISFLLIKKKKKNWLWQGKSLATRGVALFLNKYVGPV